LINTSKICPLKVHLANELCPAEPVKKLRAISSALVKENLVEFLDLTHISAAQISRKLKLDLLGAMHELFAEIIRQIGINQGFPRIRPEIGHLYLIYSTEISICFSQYRWVNFCKTKSGIKLHTRIRLLDGNILTDKVIMTVARKADRIWMDELIVEDKDAFKVFGRAYLDYDLLNYYYVQNIRSASRLKSNALVETLKEHPL